MLWDFYDMLSEMNLQLSGHDYTEGWWKLLDCGPQVLGPFPSNGVACGLSFQPIASLGQVGFKPTFTVTAHNYTGPVWVMSFLQESITYFSNYAGNGAAIYVMPATTVEAPEVPIGNPVRLPVWTFPSARPNYNPIQELDPNHNPRLDPLAPPMPLPIPVPFPVWTRPPWRPQETPYSDDWGPAPSPPVVNPSVRPGVRPRNNPVSNPTRPRPRGRPRPATSPGVRPMPTPLTNSNPTLVLTPGSQPLPTPEPHLREPPGSNTRERKVVDGGQALRNLRKVFHSMTEACDAIQAVYEALPENVRKAEKKSKRYSKCSHQANVLYRHWDEVDINQAIENLIKNHIEDKIIGTMNRGAGQVAPRGGGLPSPWWLTNSH